MIIMDEVDGMSAGDRGGVGALNALIKKTKVPIIAICNDKSTPKMKPLMHTTFQMTFKRSVWLYARSKSRAALIPLGQTHSSGDSGKDAHCGFQVSQAA